MTHFATDAELVSFARKLNPSGSAYAVVGSEAINRLSFAHVNDDITIDLVTEPCGVRCEDTAGGTRGTTRRCAQAGWWGA